MPIAPHASEGKLHDLWAKALAIEDRKGGRVVIVSTDLVGLPRGITDVVAARALKQLRNPRSQAVSVGEFHTPGRRAIRELYCFSARRRPRP